MRGLRTMLAAMAALTLGTTVGDGPATGQDFDDDLPPSDSYGFMDGPDDEGDRPRRFRREGGGRGGSVCVTSRGNCIVPPAPYNVPCGCVIPGFGRKRGAIGG